MSSGKQYFSAVVQEAALLGIFGVAQSPQSIEDWENVEHAAHNLYVFAGELADFAADRIAVLQEARRN